MADKKNNNPDQEILDLDKVTENKEPQKSEETALTSEEAAAAEKAKAERKAARMSKAERRRKKKIMRIRRKLHFYGWRVCAALFAVFVVVQIVNKNTLSLSIPAEDNITMQYGMDEPDPVTAVFKGTLLNREGTPVEVKVEGDTDYSTLGKHVATYTASYHFKKVSSTRTVEVVDTSAPVINLVHNEDYYPSKEYGYKEEGFTCTDNYDGDLTDKVEVSEETDGKITYTVTDSFGNTATVEREIPYAEKIVYLTFDDGPGKFTEQLLDTLKKYDVKATFFVTNQFPKYIDSIKREAEEGHCVAIHSYTHDFKVCYAGVDNFFNDIGKMGELCKEQTGATPTIFRFPGGSGNSVSKKYCKGVITDILKEVDSRGYQYVDWNVNSGDAEGITDPSKIASNIISGLKKHDVSIVLQHDIKEASVKAMDEVIKWGQENGYTFLPMTENSFKYHGPTIRN